jgi:hypothetical protein
MKPPARSLFRFAVAATFCFALLSACGGGGDDDKAKLRVLNATGDVASIDVTVDNDKIDERVHAAAVATDKVSDYGNLDAATYTLRLRRAGGSTALAAYTLTGDKDRYYTAVAHGREGALKLAVVDEVESESSSGNAKLRVFNSGTDTGAVDVYLTDATTRLEEVSPTIAGVGGGTIGFHTTIARGTYRLRITGKEDKNDLRLDVPELVLADKAIVNLILQPTVGGVLVNAIVLPQKGSPTLFKTTLARARLVAGVTQNAAVTAQVGSTSINTNLRSPSVGSYTLVPAGSQTVSVSVNGTSIVNSAQTLQAGGDYSLLAYGDAATATFTLLADDNRLPLTASRAKMRLIHAAANVSGGLTLAKDFVAVANDVPYGTASTPAQVDNATKARLEVTSPLFANPLYLNQEAVITSGGVYSMFMLGGAA